MNKKEDQDVDYNEVKCLKAGELNDYFQKLGITEATLFVQGNVKSITNQLLSSEDKKEKGVLLSNKDHENKNQSPFQTLTTGKFQLQSEENSGPSFLNVYNYSSVKILEGVLKILRFGTFNQEILTENTNLCLLGDIIFHQQKNFFLVIAPRIFGLNKDQIIKYLCQKNKKQPNKSYFSRFKEYFLNSRSKSFKRGDGSMGVIFFSVFVFVALVIVFLYKK